MQLVFLLRCFAAMHMHSLPDPSIAPPASVGCVVACNAHDSASMVGGCVLSLRACAHHAFAVYHQAVHVLHRWRCNRVLAA